MRKARAIETPEERKERSEENLRQAREAQAVIEQEMDEKVRRNIEQHGA